MASKKSNFETIIAAIAAEAAAPQELVGDDLMTYVDAIDEMIASLRGLKEPYRKAIRVQQSIASRSKHRAKVAEALAFYEERKAIEGVDIKDAATGEVVVKG